MEQEKQGLFGLTVDQTIKNHLYDAAKWGKFLAIVGFIMCTLIVIAGIFAAASYNEIDSYRGYGRYNGRSSTSGMGVGVMIGYILVGLLYFFPCLFLLRFSNQMKTALIADDQATLTTSFQNLKVLFRYVGVLMIVFIGLFILGMLVQLGGSSNR
jgi:hypothetical protein